MIKNYEENMHNDTQFHIAMLNTKFTEFFHKKKHQTKSQENDKHLVNTMKNLNIKKKKATQKSITMFMIENNLKNKNKETKYLITMDISHSTLDRWNVVTEEGEDADFD